MKPHLYRNPGYSLWHCSGKRVTGYGFTPLTAYQDWVRRERSAALRLFSNF